MVKNLNLKFEFVGALRLTNSKNKRPFDTLIRKMCAQCTKQHVLDDPSYVMSKYMHINMILWTCLCGFSVLNNKRK